MLQNNLFNSQLFVPKTLPLTDGLSLWSFPQSPLLSCLPIHLGLKRERLRLPSATTQVPSAHGFSFRHVLTKALVKQGGYTRFHLAIVSFLKAQMRILPKATTSTSLNVILGQITKAKKIGKGRKKKRKSGRAGWGCIQIKLAIRNSLGS